MAANSNARTYTLGKPRQTLGEIAASLERFRGELDLLMKFLSRPEHDFQKLAWSVSFESRLSATNLQAEGRSRGGGVVARWQILDIRVFVSASTGCEDARQIAIGFDRGEFAGLDQ